MILYLYFTFIDYIQIIERCISWGNASYATNKSCNCSGSLSLCLMTLQGGLCLWWTTCWSRGRPFPLCGSVLLLGSQSPRTQIAEGSPGPARRSPPRLCPLLGLHHVPTPARALGSLCLTTCPGWMSSERFLAQAADPCRVLATPWGEEEGRDGSASRCLLLILSYFWALGFLTPGNQLFLWVSGGFRKHTARGIRLHKPRIFVGAQGSRWKTPEWDLTFNHAREVAAKSNLTSKQFKI